MSVCYIDTLSMFYDIPIITYSISMPRPWRWNKSSKEECMHYWFMQTDKVFIAYYPQMYITGRLFVTFSLPKLLTGSNVYNIYNFDEDMCYRILMKEISSFPWNIINLNNIPTSFSEWQTSRMDLFIMHKIEPGEREEYQKTYELLTLPRFRTVLYENTVYLNSSFRPDKMANKILRFYPKIQERVDRLFLDYPNIIRKKHEFFMHTVDETFDLYRFEFMYRRTAVKYECKKRGVAPNVHEVLQQEFQEALIIKMVKAVGLDRKILCRNQYRKEVDNLFVTPKSRQNAKILARYIRNRRKPPLTQHQIYRVKNVLKQHDIHYITNEYINLRPVVFP